MTDRYAVIGNPISHSKSPLIHARFARETGQDIEYGALLGPLDGFAAVVRSFRAAGGLGLNVTVPFKLAACELADFRSERVRLAGAANALKFDLQGIHAENFDGIGLVNDIEHNLGLALRGKRILLVGAGGAARGVLLPFLEREPAELVIVNRTLRTAEQLAEMVAAYGKVSSAGYSDIPGERFDLVVNASSASLSGDALPLPQNVFSRSGLAYEMAYGKGLTPFLQLAADAGTGRLADGAGMLVEQAAESFFWWRGVRPATAELVRELSLPLQAG